MSSLSSLWPGDDDRAIVKEMLGDLRSEQWFECHEFVRKCVQRKARNIPPERWDDLIQETVWRISRSLGAFQFQCRLSTWIVGIVRNCIIDDYRKFKQGEQVSISAPQTDSDETQSDFDDTVSDYVSLVEDECVLRDELRYALEALNEYVKSHAHQRRNSTIIQMVIIEGRTLKEAADATGCSSAVAGYIIRSAQRYVREKLDKFPLH